MYVSYWNFLAYSVTFWPLPLTPHSHPHFTPPPAPPLPSNAGERPSTNPSNGHYFNGTQQRVFLVRSMNPEADCFASPPSQPPCLPSSDRACRMHEDVGIVRSYVFLLNQRNDWSQVR